MTAAAVTSVRSVFFREFAWLAALLFAGVVLLPLAVWFVGRTVFGDYDGGNYMDFFGTLGSRLVAGDGAAWFLVLSPYLAISALRLSALGWRLAAGGRK